MSVCVTVFVLILVYLYLYLSCTQGVSKEVLSRHWRITGGLECQAGAMVVQYVWYQCGGALVPCHGSAMVVPW